MTKQEIHYKNILMFIIFVSMVSIYENFFHYKASQRDLKAKREFYAINLDREPQKLKTITEDAAKHNIDLKKFPATDGYNILLVNETKGESFRGIDLKTGKKQFNKTDVYRIYCDGIIKDKHDLIYNFSALSYIEHLDHIISAGEIGLVCSSIRFWEKIANSEGDTIAAVFDDDVIFKDDFLKNYALVTRDLPPDWDILYLAFPYMPQTIWVRFNIWGYLYNLFNFSNCFSVAISEEGTIGYAINNHSAKKLLYMFTTKPITSIDRFILRYSKTPSDLKIYLSKLPLITFDQKAPSTIEQMGREVHLDESTHSFFNKLRWK